jgi:Leucine-rich repeat (LRR) protein
MQRTDEIYLKKRRQGNGKIAELLSQMRIKDPECIELSYNQINESLILPKSFLSSTIVNITKLKISHNQLTKLPIFLQETRHLKELDLSHNRIDFLDGDIVLCLTKTIQELKLQGNNIESIPSEIGQCVKLERLILGDDLSGNHLIEANVELGRLTSLIELRLSRNRLRSIPDEILRLPNLQWLDISHNTIKSLPKISISLSIRTLNCSDNQIKGIPRYLLKWLDTLEILDMTKNCIEAIPDYCESLKTISKLRLACNPCFYINIDDIGYRRKLASLTRLPLNASMKTLCQNALLNADERYLSMLPCRMKVKESSVNPCENCPMRFAQPVGGVLETCSFQGHTGVPKVSLSCSNACLLLKFQERSDSMVFLDEASLNDFEIV